MIDAAIGCVSQMTALWSIHKPLSVTMTKSSISRATLVSVVWKVYFLLAKKLKINARVDEMTLATSTSRPSWIKINKIPKSSAVLMPPTTMNRSKVCLFFMVCLVKFLNEIERTALSFVEDAADIFADDAETEELHTAEEQDDRHDR